LTIDQLRPSISDNGTRNFGNPPSNNRYHLATISDCSLQRKEGEILVSGMCEILALGPGTISSNAGGASNPGGPSDDSPCSTFCGGDEKELDRRAGAFPFEDHRNGINDNDEQ